MDRVLLASHLRRKGDSRTARLDDAVSVALHTGNGESLNAKLWVCEDSVCAHRLGDGDVLAAVADAHWGGSSSEAVVADLRRLWEAAEASGPERLKHALLGAEAAYSLSKPPDDRSETTVLLVHLRGRTVSYLNVGDSLLLAIGSTSWRSVNVQRGVFFGRTPLTRLSEHIEWGRFELSANEMLLLATDGLEPRTSGMELDQVAGVLRGEGPLHMRLERLVARASDEAAGGGLDNLGLAVIAPDDSP